MLTSSIPAEHALYGGDIYDSGDRNSHIAILVFIATCSKEFLGMSCIRCNLTDANTDVLVSGVCSTTVHKSCRVAKFLDGDSPRIGMDTTNHVC